MSDIYTHGHHESVLRSHVWRTAENSAGYLLSSLRAGLDLLDVGCGPGTITVDLARRVAPGSTLGLDRAPRCSNKRRAHAATQGVTVELQAGDLYVLEFPDASFDVVHAHQVLQHLTDPVRALREMRRVLRPDGVLAARDRDYSCFSWAPRDPCSCAGSSCTAAVARQQSTPSPTPAAIAQGLGARSRLPQRTRPRAHVDLRRPRVVRMVGRPMGRPLRVLRIRPASRRVRQSTRAELADNRRRVACLVARGPTHSSSCRTARSWPVGEACRGLEDAKGEWRPNIYIKWIKKRRESLARGRYTVRIGVKAVAPH